jgi:hypothetical protein
MQSSLLNAVALDAFRGLHGFGSVSHGRPIGVLLQVVSSHPLSGRESRDPESFHFQPQPYPTRPNTVLIACSNRHLSDPRATIDRYT